MRTKNGRFTNRLPPDTAQTAATVGKSLGAAALNALIVETTMRLVDALLQAVVDKRQARRAQAAARREAVAA